MKVNKEYLYDLAERVGWTAVQAVVAMLLVVVADWDYECVPILTAVLSALKGVIAKQVGDSDTAALTFKKSPPR